MLQLESMSSSLPALEQLIAPLEREKVHIVSKESNDSFIGVRYRFVESNDEGFLGVRRGRGGDRHDGGSARTVWCSTMKGAKPDEVEAAMKVCEGVSEPDRQPESTTR